MSGILAGSKSDPVRSDNKKTWKKLGKVCGVRSHESR